MRNGHTRPRLPPKHLHEGINEVIVLHAQLLRSLRALDGVPVEVEPACVSLNRSGVSHRSSNTLDFFDVQIHAFRPRLHQLDQRGCFFDAETYLRAIGLLNCQCPGVNQNMPMAHLTPHFQSHTKLRLISLHAFCSRRIVKLLLHSMHVLI